MHSTELSTFPRKR